MKYLLILLSGLSVVTAPTSSAQDSAKEVAQTILVSVPPKPHEVQSISYVEVTGIVCGSKYESDQVIDQFAKTRMVKYIPPGCRSVKKMRARHYESIKFVTQNCGAKVARTKIGIPNADAFTISYVAQFSQAFCPGKGHMTITISGPYIMA